MTAIFDGTSLRLLPIEFAFAGDELPVVVVNVATFAAHFHVTVADRRVIRRTPRRSDDARYDRVATHRLSNGLCGARTAHTARDGVHHIHAAVGGHGDAVGTIEFCLIAGSVALPLVVLACASEGRE